MLKARGALALLALGLLFAGGDPVRPGLAGLAAAATVTSGTDAVELHFASGDQLTLAGITKLAPEQVVF